MKPVFIAGIKSFFINDCRNCKNVLIVLVVTVLHEVLLWGVDTKYRLILDVFFYSIRHMVLGIIIPPKKGD